MTSGMLTPLWFEKLGLWPVLWVVVDHVRGDVDHHTWDDFSTKTNKVGGGTFWYEESLILPVFGAHAVVPRDRREDPESLRKCLPPSTTTTTPTKYNFSFYYYFYHLRASLMHASKYGMSVIVSWSTFPS